MRLNMAMDRVNVANLPRVAVYSIIRNDGERAAHELVMQSCIENGSMPVAYVDEGFPRQGHGSAWDRLVADVANRQFYGVVMRWHVKGFAEYCWQYDTRLVVLKDGKHD
jgi:hypothetical protein